MTENHTPEQTTTEARVLGARATGRQTFFELAELQGIQEATDLMLRVVRMSSLLEEADVAKWRKAYEEQEWNEYQSAQERAADIATFHDLDS